jgi:[protein-PII] uridylyltransferase
VLFDNESSAETTILEVFAHDFLGLLYAISKALFDAGVSVRAAKIGTYLDQVVDAFHVTDQRGRKLTDPAQLEALQRKLEEVVQPPALPGQGF